ncbi:aminoglycoside phosphotransferase family protein [Actinopolymorpha alba]|uniref:aminoglycoside phosphotransferase family protein n=1 Tax=Actinopolymorpha alba TaxID=533267 RepID=UPI00037197F8|nr:aminoglycoside phosphotransferase family protein [Actinopolymorpha alba]
MIVVPQDFEEGLIHAYGDAGRRWARSLPALVEQLCSEWGLQLVEDQPPYGDWNLILLVRRDHEPCVLKIFGPDPGASDEVHALRRWAGRGAVLLLEASPNGEGVLLERLDPTRPLTSIELMRAAEIAGSLIRQLTVPAPPGLPLLVDIAQSHAETFKLRQQAQGNPLPSRWVDLATQLAQELAADSGESLVHSDLHYGNVLAGTREPWLAIDPKPVIGNPERSVPELMWTRIDDAPDEAAVRDLFNALTRAGDLDAHRAWAWTIVQTVHYWLWGLNAGLTEDPVRCRRLLDTLT